MAEQWNAAPSTVALEVPQALTQSEIDQRVFDLYDEYCHGRIDRREFLLQAARGGRRARHGAGAAAALRAGPDDLLHRRADQGPVCDLPVAGRHLRHHARIPGAAERTGSVSAVLVIHENRGLNPYIEDVARRAATEGFLALAPDGLSPVGGYPGNDDDGRALQAGLDQGKLRTDMLNSARFLKAHALSAGKLGVTGFCWGGSTTNFLAVTLGADLKAGVPFYGAAAETAAVPADQGAAADPIRRERRAHQRAVAGLRGGAEGERRPPRDAHVSRHPARLSQQLDAALPGGGGQARLGADDRLLQEAPRLKASTTSLDIRSHAAQSRGHWVNCSTSADVAAVHELGVGTLRPFAASHKFVSFTGGPGVSLHLMLGFLVPLCRGNLSDRPCPTTLYPPQVAGLCFAMVWLAGLYGDAISRLGLDQAPVPGGTMEDGAHATRLVAACQRP